jgi:histidinol-phosphate aminotransferase
MPSLRPATAIAAGILDALPEAVDPSALAHNENPFSPLPGVRAALTRSVNAANRYPEFLPEALRAVIAARLRVGGEQIVVGAGATGVIMQVLHTVTGPGDRIVLTSPTFDGYPICASMARLRAETVPLDGHGHHDLTAMADAASEARVVVLCRPHNPTGTLESAADVERFLHRLPSDTVVLLDEAYIEFVAPRHRLDAPELLRRFPNVVVLRTFSKAYGLAGLRIGYGLAAPELAKTLWSMQLPFGMSITAAAAVAASYHAEAQLYQRIRLITGQRRYLRRRLRALGIYSIDGHANFLYLPDSPLPWRDVFDNAGLNVRHYGDGAARITIGGRTSTRAILEAVTNRLLPVAERGPNRFNGNAKVTAAAPIGKTRPRDSSGHNK